MRVSLKLAVSLSLIAIILWKIGGLGEVLAVLSRIHPLYVVLILLVNTLDRGLMTYKWARLLQGRGVTLPLLRGMRIYCAAMIWGMFLPATMGADAIRAFSTSRTGVDANEVVASIVVERMVGFLSALLLGLLSLVLLSSMGSLDPRFDFVWWIGGATLLGATVVFATSFSQGAFDLLHLRLLGRFRDTGVMTKLRRFHSTYRAYQNDKKMLAMFFGLTFAEQILTIVHGWLNALGLGIQVSFLYVAGAVPLAILVARLPVSIDGLGVYDGVFMLIMSLAGMPPAEAVAIALSGRILQTVSWTPWWLAHIAGTGSVRPPRPLPQSGC